MDKTSGCEGADEHQRPDGKNNQVQDQAKDYAGTDACEESFQQSSDSLGLPSSSSLTIDPNTTASTERSTMSNTLSSSQASSFDLNLRLEESQQPEHSQSLLCPIPFTEFSQESHVESQDLMSLSNDFSRQKPLPNIGPTPSENASTTNKRQCTEELDDCQGAEGNKRPKMEEIYNDEVDLFENSDEKLEDKDSFSKTIVIEDSPDARDKQNLQNSSNNDSVIVLDKSEQEEKSPNPTATLIKTPESGIQRTDTKIHRDDRIVKLSSPLISPVVQEKKLSSSDDLPRSSSISDGQRSFSDSVVNQERDKLDKESIEESEMARKSPKKSFNETSKQSCDVKRKRKILDTSDEEAETELSKNKRRVSPRKKDEFKKPSQVDRTLCLVGGKDGMTPEKFELLSKFLKENDMIFHEIITSKDKMGNLHAKLLNVSVSAIRIRTCMTKRLSDGSTTSSVSTSSGTCGYVADMSSSGSSVATSDSSKRDRISLIPEEVIKPHNVVSKLPTEEQKYKGKAAKKVQVEVSSAKSPVVVDANNSPPMKDIRKSTQGQEKVALNDSCDAVVSDAKDGILDSSFERASVEVEAGCRVFAKYIEGTTFRYWPAIVQESVQSGKWLVIFDDKKERQLREEEIIPVYGLIPGDEVEIILRDEYAGVSSTGRICSFPDSSQNGSIAFHVRIAGVSPSSLAEERLVVSADMFLTMKQAQSIKKSLGGKWSTPAVSKAELDLANIVHGSRTRSTNSKSKNSSDVMPSPKSTPRRKKANPIPNTASKSSKRGKSASKKGGDFVETSAAEESAVEDVAPKARKLLFSTTDDERETSAKKVTKSRKRGRRLSKEFDTSSIFAGMTFILTKGTRPERGDYNDELDNMESETNDEESETESTLMEPPPFNKADVRKKILDHGGNVLHSFPGAKQKIPEKIYIITDRPCETMTFLLGLAYNFPRVNYNWILNSVIQKKRLDMKSYYLQVGYSEEHNCIIEEFNSGDRRKLLENTTVLVTSKTCQFIDDWKLLLSRLGATVYSKTTGKLDRSLKKIDVVIADKDAPEGVYYDVKRKHIPIVTSKWIIQSLINGKQVPKDKYALS